MQPIQGAAPRPPGEPSSAPSAAGELPLSSQQRTVLERLITRIVALSQQQSAEVWAGLKHDLGMKNDTPLLSRHFPAAEQNLNQRLTSAQTSHATRQIVQQLSDLLPQGNNRQAVSDYIRQQFGHSALSQLTPQQLKSVLTLLQNNQLGHPPAAAAPGNRSPLAGGRTQYPESTSRQTHCGNGRVREAYLAIDAGAFWREERGVNPGKTFHFANDMAASSSNAKPAKCSDNAHYSGGTQTTA